LPILESAEAVDAIKEGDQLEVELESGRILNLRTGESYQAAPFPDFMQAIMDKGGLIEYVRDKMNK
jgi:3-isopropylmalate/(R)-2-methylmalate dehydratase small subunit